MTELEEQHMREELRENTKMTSAMYAMLVENGLVKKVSDIHETMQTKQGCEQMRSACEAVRVAAAGANRKWWKSIDRVLAIGLALLTLLLGSGILARSAANAKQNKDAIELLQQLKSQIERGENDGN